MDNMKYKGFETSYSLITAYEILALEYKKQAEVRYNRYTGLDIANKEVHSMDYNNLGFTLALLNINAAIVEGVMRSILSEIVSEEIERQTKAGIKAGRMERSAPENLLKKFFIEIDAQGGWERLKEQYASYLGLVIDQETSESTKGAMSALFALRNIFAHGTALIHPSEKVPDELKDEPIFKWQSRLQGISVHMKKQFKHDDIFQNLAEFKVPEYFLEKTKVFLDEILPAIKHQPQRAEKTISAIKGFKFGYINISK